MPYVVRSARIASRLPVNFRFGQFSWRRLLAQFMALLLVWQSAAVPLNVSAGTPETARPAVTKRQDLKTTEVAATGVVLTALATGFNGHNGIDYHAAQNKLLVTANAPTGQPKNFELIAADGSHATYTNLAGLTGELKIATARDDGSGRSYGGFAPGEMFIATGAPGTILRVSASGNVVRNPWVSLPNENGVVTGLTLDRTALYGGDLLAVTATGRIWRVGMNAQATLVAELGTALTGVAALPDDADKYGPWAGRILTGAPLQGTLFAVNAQGQSTTHQFGINPSEVRLIPAHENFFGIDTTSQKNLGCAR